MYPQRVCLKGRLAVELDLVNFVRPRPRPVAPARREYAYSVAFVGVLIDTILLPLGYGEGEGQENVEPSDHALWYSTTDPCTVEVRMPCEPHVPYRELTSMNLLGSLSELSHGRSATGMSRVITRRSNEET